MVHARTPAGSRPLATAWGIAGLAVGGCAPSSCPCCTSVGAGCLSCPSLQVGSFSVAEVVLRLTGADEALASYLSPAQTAWLDQTSLMDELVKQVRQRHRGAADARVRQHPAGACTPALLRGAARLVQQPRPPSGAGVRWPAHG